MSLPELTAIFSNVRAALGERGRFLFDLNTEHKYTMGWSGSFAIVDPDVVGAFRATVHASERRADLAATLFDAAPRDAWRRTDLVLHQTWYTDADVRVALETAGFTAIELHQPAGPDKIYVTATAPTPAPRD